MRRFLGSLQAAQAKGRVPVIPDLKQISPKEGHLFKDRDPVEWAKKMEALGAPALSVVTEPEHFGGSIDLLQRISAAVQIPILRKDFITGQEDLTATQEAGADAVLLICACLSWTQLQRLYWKTLELGLEPLVETHTREELCLAQRLGAKLVGINNRDILALERDSGTISITRQLAAGKPEGAFLISESGILSPEEGWGAVDAGADAILVGTAIWRAPDPAAFYQTLCNGRRETV